MDSVGESKEYAALKERAHAHAASRATAHAATIKQTAAELSKWGAVNGVAPDDIAALRKLEALDQ